MPEASALALAVHRLVLRTQQGVLRHVWLAAHHLVLRAVVKLVVGGDEATTYLRAGFGYRDVIYGLSDLDVSIVADDPGTCARARQRWRWLSRNVPGLGHLVHLAVYERAELALAASAPSLDAREAMHLRPHPPHDEAYLRHAPRPVRSAVRLATGCGAMSGAPFSPPRTPTPGARRPGWSSSAGGARPSTPARTPEAHVCRTCASSS